MSIKSNLTFQRKQCLRRSRSVRYTKKNKLYWDEAINSMEKERQKSTYERLDHLKEIFDPETLCRVAKILLNKDVIVANEQKPEEIDAEISPVQAPVQNITESDIYRSNLEDPPDIRGHPKSTETNMEKKSNIVLHQIAKRFVDWFKKEFPEDDTIDIDLILNLFSFEFLSTVGNGLAVKVSQLFCVTESLAMARIQPEASVHTRLKRELRRDYCGRKVFKRAVAFGRTNPCQTDGARLDTAAIDFVTNKRVPQDIASMKVVWGGIEHLRSTEAYCRWLQLHKKVKPPEYLKKSGLLDVNYGSMDGLFPSKQVEAKESRNIGRLYSLVQKANSSTFEFRRREK